MNMGSCGRLRSDGSFLRNSCCNAGGTARLARYADDCGPYQSFRTWLRSCPRLITVAEPLLCTASYHSGCRLGKQHGLSFRELYALLQLSTRCNDLSRSLLAVVAELVAAHA
jgi:hypothetical protein